MIHHLPAAHPDLSASGAAPFMVGLRIFLDGERLGTITEVAWEPTIMDWVATVTNAYGSSEMVSGDDWVRCDGLWAGTRYHVDANDPDYGV